MIRRKLANGEWVAISGRGKDEIIVVLAQDSQTISGISVPKLTEQQVQIAYNSIVAGKGVFVQGENNDYYAVYFANEVSSVPTIYLIYKDSHIIKYELDDEVEITVKEIGSGTGAVESVNGKDGIVVLDATDIKLTTNQQTIQANIIRIDEEINRIEAEIPDITPYRTSADQDVIDDDLQDQITNLQSRGRYLSNWNAVDALPATNPTTELPYTYRQGDYFIVGKVDYDTYNSSNTYNTGDKVVYSNNRYVCLEDNVTGEWDSSKWEATTLVLYRPNGSSYTGDASTVVETETLGIGDSYTYDGSQWVYQKNAPIDLTGYAKTDEANIFSLLQTFLAGLKLTNWSIEETTALYFKRANTNKLGFTTSSLNLIDYNLLFAGTSKLTDGTNETTVGQLVNGTFNVINASDIGTKFTNEQYALLLNGKNTKIIGNFQGFINPTIISLSESGGENANGFLLGFNSYSNGMIQKIKILKTSGNHTITTTNAVQFVGKEDKINLFNIGDLNGKTFPSYLKGALYYDGNNLSWNDSFIPSVETISTATYSGGFTSNKEYKFSVTATSLSIAALEKQDGDLTPCWKIRFIVGSGFTFSSTPTLVWRNGEPNWNELVGEEVEILIEPSLTANTFNAWIIK